MEKRDDGGLVAPDFEARTPNRNYPDYTLVPVGGMTLRQWYKGMIAAQVAQTYAECDPKHAARIAAVCGSLADALIAEDKEEMA